MHLHCITDINIQDFMHIIKIGFKQITFYKKIIDNIYYMTIFDNDLFFSLT